MMSNMKNVLANIKLAPKGGLTTREFLMLVFLIIAIEGYLLYAYIIQPAYVGYTSAIAEMVSKQTTLDALIQDYARKDEMEKEIASLENEIVEIEKQIPSYLSQEEVTLFLESLSTKNRVTIQSIAFANTDELPLKALKADNEHDITVAVAAASADPLPVVTEQLIAINFVCTYQDIYNFMNDVEDSIRKVSVKGMTITKEKDETMSGQMTLSFMSYWDESKGQKPYVMTTSEIPGKTDLFKEYPGYVLSESKGAGSTASAAAARPDFYLMINSYLNNSSKTMLMNYYNKGSEATADTNGTVAANMTINGKDGNYTFQYNFGDYNIVENDPTEIKDGKIRMEVLVQPRRSDDDKVGVMLDITNNTDVPFEITVKGDDAGNPRFIRGKTAGSVTVKQVK